MSMKLSPQPKKNPGAELSFAFGWMEGGKEGGEMEGRRKGEKECGTYTYGISAGCKLRSWGGVLLGSSTPEAQLLGPGEHVSVPLDVQCWTRSRETAERSERPAAATGKPPASGTVPRQAG